MLVSLLIRLLINVDIVGVVEKVAHIKSGFIHMMLQKCNLLHNYNTKLFNYLISSDNL